MVELALTRERLMEALTTRNLSAITRWHRVDGIPRTHDLERSLRAELRDPLWLLARQWQMGEFIGDDAGSPIFAKLHLGKTRFTGYRSQEFVEQPFDDSVPLETLVEQRPIPFQNRAQPLSLDIRLVMGRQLAKLLTKHGLAGYIPDFRSAFRVVRPEGTTLDTAQVAAHSDAWQHFAAFADRAIDGYLWYRWLSDHPAPRNYSELPAPISADPGDGHAFDMVATAFLRWYERLIAQPTDPDQSAWDAARLEYRFACSAPTDSGREQFVASEYSSGDLDWYALDRGPVSNDAPPPEPGVSTTRTSTFLPVAVEFNGMANTRYWSFEDRRVSFAAVKPDTTDIAKLLLLEFGLVYANDWCLVPVPLEEGTLAEVLGLAVTNVFGERFWITPAGSSSGDDWQKFRLFTLSPAEPGVGSKQQLLMLPSVPKVQAGPVLEEVHLIRDEMANMVWGVESSVALPHGEARSGSGTAAETGAYYARVLGVEPLPPELENTAKVRYELMTTVPENWIPFVPVHVPGSSRSIQLQRAGMPRPIGGGAIEKIQPRTSLMREGLDRPVPTSYFVHEEEVPRAGAHVRQYYQRTRWTDGRAFVWLGAEKRVGRGEGSSGLEFDRLVELKKT